MFYFLLLFHKCLLIYCNIPKKVFIDQHAGQLTALIENWEKDFNTEIVFCMMHIHRNINENIGKNIIITLIYHILGK